MNYIKNKKYYFIGGLLGLLLVLWVSFGNESTEASAIYVTPEEGAFNVQITTSGELMAKNTTSIRGPEGMREFRIYNVPIQRLVDEGTVVEKGDFVAALDRSELSNSLQDAQLELEESQSEYELAKLDSSLTLSKARDNLVNLQYSLEEAEIAVEQSKYESPATQRQVKIALERAERELSQAKKNYLTEEKQAEATLREIETDMRQDEREVQRIEETLEDFTIHAPENGMVIYKRNNDGSKVTEGSSISAWDPVVAELPDFSVMNSITYINEVDIQNVEVGQSVDVTLDAMPEKQLTGSVTDIANIGEQHPNSSSKVFQVIVELHESDRSLRPSMTTGNTIHIDYMENARYIPLEAIHTVDSLSYVFQQDGMNTVMQQVVLGMMNDNDVVVKEGVASDDRLYMSTPADTSNVEKRLLSKEVVEEYQDTDLQTHQQKEEISRESGESEAEE